MDTSGLGLLVEVLACNRRVAPLGTGFFSPMSILSSTPYHRILRWGRKAIGPGELVNISNLCYCSLLVKPHLVKSRIDGLNNR